MIIDLLYTVLFFVVLGIFFAVLGPLGPVEVFIVFGLTVGCFALLRRGRRRSRGTLT